jgi:hypothetical protein
MAEVKQLLHTIAVDPWRSGVGYSDDVAEAQSQMFPSQSDDEVASLLNGWIQRHQPCLFGRLAARSNQLSYCILHENDLRRDDLYIRDKIQERRTDWTRHAFKGDRSGFVILAVSEALANAVPNEAIAAIAHRLAQLYLVNDEIEFDAVHLEEVFLEQPGRSPATWRWDAGINYFAAHGDKRWWHDHRIPGGIGFSINSVGHMAKSGLMRNALAKLSEVMGTDDDPQAKAKVGSLTKALELAMTTIERAQDTVSGKATALLPLPQDQNSLPPRPELPDFLEGKDHKEYFGYYHTDFTLPREYFRSDVERPADIAGHTLDFTYLFDPRVQNPAFVTMGEGRRIRSWKDLSPDEQKRAYSSSSRLSRALPKTISLHDSPRLKAIAQ